MQEPVRMRPQRNYVNCCRIRMLIQCMVIVPRSCEYVLARECVKKKAKAQRRTPCMVEKWSNDGLQQRKNGTVNAVIHERRELIDKLSATLYYRWECISMTYCSGRRYSDADDRAKEKEKNTETETRDRIEQRKRKNREEWSASQPHRFII